MFVQTFKILVRNLWQKVPYVLHLKDKWKKEKLEIEGKMNHSILLFSYKIDQLSVGVYKIWRLALIGSKKCATNIVIGETKKKKKTGQIKGMIRMRMLILSYKI